jgi:hypothetical protein
MGMVAKERVSADEPRREIGNDGGADALPEETVHEILEYEDCEDSSRPIRGIANGLAVGTLLWGLILLALRLMA